MGVYPKYLVDKNGYMLLDMFDIGSALGLKMHEVCIWLLFVFFQAFTRVEKFGLAKGNWGEGEVATDEDHVGDAQGGQQVVEYVVHFPSISEIFRIYI